MNKKNIIHELLIELKLYKQFLLYLKSMKELNNSKESKVVLTK